jgi:hypothetical protein
MKREMLSLLIATGVFAAIVLANYAMRRIDDGAAYAAGGSQMAREILQGAGIPSSRLRDLRQSISADPANILDVSGREIYAVLSQPEMVRTDSPTTVWQYRNSFCVLDVYFTTRDTTAARAPAVHYEIRAREKDVPDDAVQERCARDLVRAHAGMNLINANAFYKKSY